MTQCKTDQSKRRLLIASLQGAALLPLSSLGVRVAHGGDLEPLSVDDPVAKSLAYHDDAATVDASAMPEFKADRNCGNCSLYQGGDGATGGCSIFPGKSVARAGWCKVWVVRN